jgi:hypothetical protein
MEDTRLKYKDFGVVLEQQLRQWQGGYDGEHSGVLDDRGNRHQNDELTITAGMMTAGMTMASIAAGTKMTATAIAGHNKHSMDKNGRGTAKAGFYLHLLICLTDDED